MPKIYRAMREENELPVVSQGADGLGVRPGTDIPVDATDQVRPEQGGMSVSPALRDLPAHRVPVRLRMFVPGARGKDNLAIWSHGVGEFAAGDVAENLVLRLDSQNDRHGLVEPAAEMTLNQYQAALAATREKWRKDEI